MNVLIYKTPVLCLKPQLKFKVYLTLSNYRFFFNKTIARYNQYQFERLKNSTDNQLTIRQDEQEYIHINFVFVGYPILFFFTNRRLPRNMGNGILKRFREYTVTCNVASRSFWKECSLPGAINITMWQFYCCIPIITR